MTADAALLDLARKAFDPDAPPRVGVAVSGGGDSMALLHLLVEAGGPQVFAVTVDHGLRPEAAAEAQFVARACARLGVPHEVLRWEGPAPRGNLMDQARRARLRLIAGWAAKHAISHVALGHTADDQAETFLMRLAREAGLEGLSGMRRSWDEHGIRWHRPLLSASRAGLRAALCARGAEWVEDPSNDNPDFDRVKARRALAGLRDIGISGQTLSQVVDHLARAEEVVRAALAAAASAHVTCPSGDVVIATDPFRALLPELQRRLIVAALRWVAGADYAPRRAAIASLLGALQAPCDRTLAGCRIRARADDIRIFREARAVAALRTPITAVWDRWRLEGPSAPGQEIAALGEHGLRTCPDWRAAGLPRASLLASPAVWEGARLVAAPLAGLENGWKARIAGGSFHSVLFNR